MNPNRFESTALSYEQALSKFPNTRNDAQWLLRHLDLQKDDTVFEIAGGSGYLTKPILERIAAGTLIVQDISEKMLEISAEKHWDYYGLQYYHEQNPTYPEIGDGTIDKAVCLGGWHHIEDQVTVTRSVQRRLKQGGVFCVGDFADNSPVQRYFDERVNVLTETGHIGFFPSKSRMVNLGRLVETNTVCVEEAQVPFFFNKMEDIGVFFQLVLDLDQQPESTQEEVLRYFDIRETEAGWEVMVDYVYAKYSK